MSSYQCSKCDFTSKTKGTVKTHINSGKCEGAIMIENIVLIKCEMCGKECETEKLMSLHKKNCVKKRVEIINEDTDGELKKQNTEMMKMILSLVKEVDECRNENKDQKKRIEKLEKGNKETNDNKKKGFEEINGETEDILCYGKPIIKTPANYEQVLSIVDSKNYKKGKREIEYEVQILDKDEETHTGTATSSGFYLKGSDKKILYGNFSLLLGNECDEYANYRYLKNQRCYCTKHFNKETGKPLT